MLMLCYYRLSMEHPTIPLAELAAILEVEAPESRVLGYYTPIALVDCPEGSVWSVVRSVVGRAGFTKEGGVLLGLYSDEEELAFSVNEMLDRLQALGMAPYRFEAHRFLGLWREARPAKLALTLARRATSRGVSVSPYAKSVITISYAEGVIAVGLRVARQDTKGFQERSPGRRPFFKPGPLDPRLSRAFVNLSRLRVGGVFWDPFCGTGGMVLEACLVGASRCICGDIDVQMAVGSSINLSYYGAGSNALSQLADATKPPLRSASVDSIATDPPYGRSTTLGGRGRRALYRDFLEAAYSILKRGSYLVFAAPVEEEPGVIAGDGGYRVLARHHMYVHGSLVREIVVARVGA